MKDSDLSRAQKTIATLQSQYSELRQSTYKTVHDDIGSTLSTASIKAKILGDKITNEVDKHHLQEIHKLIKETMDQVTLLNKKLKSVWIPQGMDTFFESLEKDFKSIEETYPIRIVLSVTNRQDMKKQSLLTLGTMHDFAQAYIRDSISRLVEELKITVTISAENIEWTFNDSSPCKTSSESFKNMNEKLSIAKARLSIQESNSTLTFPNQGGS